MALGTDESVLLIEVSPIQRCPYRGIHKDTSELLI